MALEGVALPLSNGGVGVEMYDENQLYELEQYHKIVRLGDKILSGKHPTFKPSLGLESRQTHFHTEKKNSQPHLTSTSVPNDTDELSRGPRATGVKQSAVAGPSVDTSSASKPPVSGNAEINPIFLEKSDDLISAEIQIQRQRLERALKTELEQRQVSKNTQPDCHADLDISEVLAKALALVQATGAPSPTADSLTANHEAANIEAANDSFDDATFYSSRHDTPESVLISRVPNASEEPDAHRLQDNVQPQSLQNTDSNSNRPNPTQGSQSTANAPRSYQPQYVTPVNAAQAGLIPGLNSYMEGGNTSMGQNHNTSGEQTVSDESRQASVRQLGNKATTNAPNQGDDPYADTHPPSPLVRSHDLIPAAPQPVQVSSLAVEAGGLSHTRQQGLISAVGTPAQVAALRNEPVMVTSPESSSQGGKGSEKKKGKRKKRKAERQAPQAESVPYIKPEPRSPSPVTAPSYIRPNKRQRNTQGQVNDAMYAEPRYENPAAHSSQGQYQPNSSGDGRIPIGYAGTVAYQPRAASTTVISVPRYGVEYIDGSSTASNGYIPRRPSPGSSAVSYLPREIHPTRSVSQVVISDPYRDAPRYHGGHGPQEAPRLSVRPEGAPFMAPPNVHPTRIVVDAYGREYIEPLRPAMRQSAGPPIRTGEPEVVYEQAPPTRTVSRLAGPEHYEDGGVVYARPSPSYGMPRRYVTQPEMMPQDYRDPREYSARPVAYPGDFVQVMAPQDRRQMDERPREYIARTASVRPAESVQYEGGYQDYSRMHTARPEALRPEYRASVHPERGREAAQPYMREYGGQSVRHSVVPQDYGMVQPVERYHEPQVRAPDGMAFIEPAPGATPQIVYGDDARREVYR